MHHSGIMPEDSTAALQSSAWVPHLSALASIFQGTGGLKSCYMSVVQQYELGSRQRVQLISVVVYIYDKSGPEQSPQLPTKFFFVTSKHPIDSP